MLALTAIGYVHAVQGLREEAQATLRADAAVVGNAIDGWNRARLDEERAIANTPAARRALSPGAGSDDGDLNDVDDIIFSLKQALGDVTAIIVMDRQGTVVRGTIPNNNGRNYRQRAYFQRAIEGADYVSSLVISLADGTYSVFRAIPVRDAQNRIVGVVAARTTPDLLQDAVGGVNNPPPPPLDQPDLVWAIEVTSPTPFTRHLNGADYLAVATPL